MGFLSQSAMTGNIVSWNKYDVRGPCMYVWLVEEALNMVNTSKVVSTTPFV